MLFLLSPAKSLDFNSPTPSHTSTFPLFVTQSQTLIDIMHTFNAKQLGELMGISDALAQLNLERFTHWSINHHPRNAKSAIFAFNGDVYDGLSAYSLTTSALNWMQEHLCILSGLYGVLRPFDLLQPYRLEMGTRINKHDISTLYQFWGDTVTNYLNQRLHEQKSSLVINLASQEYAKVVIRKQLNAKVVDIVFEERRGSIFKVISFSAKKARGMMMRYCTLHQPRTLQSLLKFSDGGYEYSQESSDEYRLVFRNYS